MIGEPTAGELAPTGGIFFRYPRVCIADKLFENLKFVKEGTLRDRVWRERKWWDSIIYSKLSTEYNHDKKD